MRLRTVRLRDAVQSPHFATVGDYTARDFFEKTDDLDLEVSEGALFIRGPNGTTVTPFSNVRQAMLLEAEKPAAKARAK